MGYLKIENLYRNQKVLAFKEVYALEKVHGTSAHIRFQPMPFGEKLQLYGGGTKHETFAALFDQDDLIARFMEIGHPQVVVYGESYGGKEQGMSATYGAQRRFIAFDVQVGDVWLDVINAHDVANRLGLEFVPYNKGPATEGWLNDQRDLSSRVGEKFGTAGKLAEGIVIRPPFEVTGSNGDRIMAKHKRDEFRETKTPRQLATEEERLVLADAESIAAEWVTPMRLEHVLQKLPGCDDLASTPIVIRAMLSDIDTEGAGEFVPSKEANKAIGKLTAKLYHAWCKAKISAGQ